MQAPARVWNPSKPPVLSHAPVLAEAGGLLGVSPGDLFAFVSDPHQLKLWRPSIFRVLVDDSNAARPGRIGSVRTLKPFLFGPASSETILSWRRPHLLSFAVKGVFPIARRIDVLTIESDGLSAVRFRWVVHGTPTGGRLQRWWLRRQLQGMLDVSWRRLKKRFPYR